MKLSSPLRGSVCGGVAFGLLLLAAVSYVPAQSIPLLADDYVQIQLGRVFGGPSGWSDLAADALYRCRATSLVLSWLTFEIFGMAPSIFKASSLLLHILNVWLVFAMGVWRPVGWRISAVAAAFFAVAEGHQEAVMWYAALPELLVFTFTLAAFLCWVCWLQAGLRKPAWYFLAFAFFVLAIASKESGVCVVGLQVLAMIAAGRPQARAWLGLLPFVGAAGVYFLMAYAARSNHLHFNDGTFSLSAPFALILLNSMGRILWIWGIIAFAVLAVLRWSQLFRFSAGAFAWMAITLLPYSFLTYMLRVPSRHTYLASVALAMLVGAALVALYERQQITGRRSLALSCVVLSFGILAHNWSYLWTKKQAQYRDRAAATQALLEFARDKPGPIVVHCFPYAADVAQYALHLELGRPIESVHFPEPCSGAPRFGAGAHVSPPPSEIRAATH